jgi:hypothetical protein
MNYIVIIAVGAVTISFIVVVSMIFQRRLGKHRGVTREEFIRAFESAGIPLEIPAAVYDLYKSRVSAKEFSVAPDDDYETVFSAGDEEIEDDSEALLKQLGFKLPSDYSSFRPEVPLVKTLGDMVRWLNWVRQHQTQPSPSSR